jgi:nicotinamide mononucleotide adenylyltransferase
MVQPSKESLIKMFREMGFEALSHPNEPVVYIPIESGEAPFLINVSVEAHIMAFSAIAWPAEKIPITLDTGLTKLLLQTEGGICHYVRDLAGNIIVRAAVHSTLVSKEVARMYIEEIRRELAGFVGKVLSKCAFKEGGVLLFPARLQPPHRGHIDAISRMLEGDVSILADPTNSGDCGLLEGFSKLVISMSQVCREKGNPLSLGERRDLLSWEFTNNTMLQRNQHRVDFESCPEESATNWLPALIRNLPNRPDAIVTANTETIVAARDLNLRVLAIRRERSDKQEGKEIRKLIAENNLPAAKTYLTDSIYTRCIDRGYFEIISNIETSY